MEFTMKMFMALMLVTGIIITMFAFKIAPSVKECSAKTQGAVRGLTILGTMLSSVAATYLIAGCNTDATMGGNAGLIFVTLMFAISIVLISLSSVIKSTCSHVKSDAVILLTLSVIMAIASGGYLGHKGYKRVKGHRSPLAESAASFRF